MSRRSWVALVLVLVGGLLAGVPAAAGGGSGFRLASTLDDPVEVAVEFSQLAAPGGSDGVKLASSGTFPDALGAAQYEPDWPLLLTDGAVLSGATMAEIRRLGATKVTVLGGTGAISEDVVNALQDEGLDVERLAGSTRIGTATRIARDNDHRRFLLLRAFAPPSAGSSAADATQAFADSLAAGAWAGIEGDVGIVLTSSDELSSETAAFLQHRQSNVGNVEVMVVGGTSAISDTVVRQVDEIVSSVRRVAGPSRVLTAAAVAEEIGMSSGVLLMDGRHGDAWAAGFTSAAYARATGYPVLLTEGDELADDTASWIRDNTVDSIVCGPGVPADVCDDAATLAGVSVTVNRHFPTEPGSTDWALGWNDQISGHWDETGTFGIDGDDYVASMWQQDCFNRGESYAVDYLVPEGFTTFTTVAGITDTAHTGWVATFEFFLDGYRQASVEATFGNPAQVAFPVEEGQVLRILIHSVDGATCGGSRLGGAALGTPLLRTGEFPSVNFDPEPFKRSMLTWHTPVNADYYRDDKGTKSINGDRYVQSVSFADLCGYGGDGSGVYEWDLSRDYETLITTAGMVDTTPAGWTGTVTFSGDGEILETVDVTLGETVPVEIDVTNVLRLRIVGRWQLNGAGCGGSSAGPVIGTPTLLYDHR